MPPGDRTAPALASGSDQSPLVSVLLPAHNASAFIASALHSVLAQTYRNLEVLVVDDGSRDETPAIVAAFATRDDRVVLLQQPNRGVAAARNLALRHARGDFLAPIDADDQWCAEKIRKQVRRMEEGGPSVGLVYAWSQIIDEQAQVLGWSHPWRIEGEVFDDLIAMNFIGSASVPLIRRSCLDMVGGYNTRFRDRGAQGCEDWDLALRIAERCRVAVVPEYLLAYRRVRGSMSSDTDAMVSSHRMLLEELQRRHPAISRRLLRWSRGQMYGHVAATAWRRGLPALAVRWMLSGLLARDASFLSPRVLELVVSRWSPHAAQRIAVLWSSSRRR